MDETTLLHHFLNTVTSSPSDVEQHWPCGKDTIRVRMKLGSEFVFTYHNFKDWRLETITAFSNRISGIEHNAGKGDRCHTIIIEEIPFTTK